MVFQQRPVLLSDETVMWSKADPDGLLIVIGVPDPSFKFTYPLTLFPVDLSFWAKLWGRERRLGDGDTTGFCWEAVEPGSDIFRLSCLSISGSCMSETGFLSVSTTLADRDDLTRRVMLDVRVIARACFRTSDLHGMLFSELVLGVFHVLVHVADLVEEAQQGHVDTLGNVPHSCNQFE
jgi:hypothetical protein